LIYKKPSQELIYQLMGEMRHNRELPVVLNFLYWVGWRPEDILENLANVSKFKEIG
jgi:hypothetical protein